MRVSAPRSAFMLALFLVSPALARAQKLDKDDKAFLDTARPILLLDEEKVFKGLKDKADRLEFQKIFWARRDPDLTTPENEYRVEFEKVRAEADRLYRVPVLPGAQTDCGRVFILIGKPDEVQKQETMQPGLRPPEIWTYRDRPGRVFTGGKALFAFDEDCRGPSSLGPQLERVAAMLVVQQNLEYKPGKDGHLVKLADMLPKDSAARALLKQPRQDFALGAQAAYLKVADGGTALLGLVHGEAAGLEAADGPGGKTVSVSVGASALTEEGRESGWSEQTVNAPVGADGAFVASFKLALQPGKYTLKAVAVDTKGGKGSLTSMPIEVPHFGKVETAADGSTTPVPSAASIVLVAAIEELPPGTKEDPAHPFAAFALGPVRLHPFFGTSFAKADEVNIFWQAYDFALDGASGKANAMARVTILRDGRQAVAERERPIDTAVAGDIIGPVQLAGFTPGKYVVRLKIADKVSNREVVQEAPFEVRP